MSDFLNKHNKTAWTVSQQWIFNFSSNFDDYKNEIK